MVVWYCEGIAEIVLDVLAKAGLEIEPQIINCLEDEEELKRYEKAKEVYIYFPMQGPCGTGEIYKISGNLELAGKIVDKFNTTYGKEDEEIAEEILRELGGE